MRRSWKTVVFVLALAGSITAATTLGVHRASAADTAVTIQNFSFQPSTVTVSVGTTVTWTNQDTAPHTATSDTNAFTTSTLATGQSGSVTFNTPGTFPYHCAIHPNMKGTVIVQSATTPGTTTTAATATATTAPAATSTSVPLSASPVGMPAYHIGLAGQLTRFSWEGYAQGKAVSYLVTDASDRAQAASLHVNFAPALRRGAALSRMYLVTGRAADNQLAVFASSPGASAYSPLRQEIVVRWKAGAQTALLRSEKQIRSLAKQGKLTLRTTSTVLNAPMIPSGT